MASKRRSRKPGEAGKNPEPQMWVAENTSRILKGPSGLRGSPWVNPVEYYVRLADRALAMGEPVGGTPEARSDDQEA